MPSGCATAASATVRRVAPSMVRTVPICSSRMRAKAMPARLCSTGEQKALLIGLVLAHAELVARRREGAPILLLDEVTAHLDAERRAALFEEILRLGAQAWMTGTDAQAFSWLAGKARFWRVEDGHLSTFDGHPVQGAAAPSN